MPTYVYQSEDGRTLERLLPMSRAPKIGHRTRHEGVEYRRLPGVGTFMRRQLGERTSAINGLGTKFVEDMTEAERACVDGVDDLGFPKFSSPARARQFSEAQRREVEKTGTGIWSQFGQDGPSATEVALAKQRGEVIR
jgi:hypothetical protein